MFRAEIEAITMHPQEIEVIGWGWKILKVDFPIYFSYLGFWDHQGLRKLEIGFSEYVSSSPGLRRIV